MHSSILRGSDFRLRWRGEAVAHGAFFRDHAQTTRLGILTPDRTEGIGAATFALACVTAFYDRYRAAGGSFFAYPDFFTFQRREPMANYGSFDFWPDKDILIADDADATAAAIAERAINVLLIPANARPARLCQPLHVESLRRNVNRCFVYHADGAMDDADLEIACEAEPLGGYVSKVLASVGAASASRSDSEATEFRQSFREVPFQEMLAYL